VSKSPAKSEPKAPARSALQLDDKIAKVTTKTVQGLRRNQILIISALGVTIAIALIVSAVNAVKRQELKSYSAEAYALFGSLKSRDANVVASFPEINSLLKSVRGQPVAKSIYRNATNYLLAHSKMALLPSTPSNQSGIPGQPPAPVNAEPETTLEKSKVPEVLEQAKKIALDAQTLFPEDVDMQDWAAESLKRVEALRQLGTESAAPERGFSPPLPDAAK
jgi:hypothetical protein